MNKEILETTIKFHDTYERLSKEFNYTTREDTREFDINSNNGKLMYAVVNEIVSPLLNHIKKLEINRDKAIAYIETLTEPTRQDNSFHNNPMYLLEMCLIQKTLRGKDENSNK